MVKCYSISVLQYVKGLEERGQSAPFAAVLFTTLVKPVRLYERTIYLINKAYSVLRRFCIVV